MSEVRPIVLGIFQQGETILLFRGYDIDGKPFYRPLGGGINFGEYGHQTLAREIREEIKAEITNVRYLGLVENIFIAKDGPGHEIVLLYEAEFVDPAIYRQPVLIVEEDDGHTFEAFWMPVSDFAAGRATLYPSELLAFCQTAS